MSVAAPYPQLAPGIETQLSSVLTGRLARLLPATIIVTVAALIRFWSLGATFESSDQGDMAWMIHHCFGFRWIFAHTYGPTLPLYERAFSTVLSLLHIPSGDATCRLPVALVSLAQVLITYPFVKRLGASAREALCATACAALLPTLVTDGHYARGYVTVWLFTGTLAIWTMLLWLDAGRLVHLAVAALALFLHLLSNVYSVGVPVVLLALWMHNLRNHRRPAVACDGRPPCRSLDAAAPQQSKASMTNWKPALRSLRAPALAFILPCFGALTVMFLSWRWTGAGQLGRLLQKRSGGAMFCDLQQFALAPQLWCEQFGYVFGLVAAAGLAWGCLRLVRAPSRRLGLPALWALAAGFPLTVLTNWSALGYPGSYLGAYFIEIVYGAGILGGVLTWRLIERQTARPLPRVAAITTAVLIIAILGLGTADQCLFGARWTHLTGVETAWGMVRPDTGIKAAGCYIREHVPADCVILSLHNNKGMELPLAEYYTGRHVLADYDLKPGMHPALLARLSDFVDVVVLDVAGQSLMDAASDFEPVCTIRRGSTPVRYLYARRTRGLKRADDETVAFNQRYESQFLPTRVPVPLLSPPDFEQRLDLYQRTVKELKRAARSQKS